VPFSIGCLALDDKALSPAYTSLVMIQPPPPVSSSHKSKGCRNSGVGRLPGPWCKAMLPDLLLIGRSRERKIDSTIADHRRPPGCLKSLAPR
jgi:hypothetical protein